MTDHLSPMQYEMFIRRAHGYGREQKGASCDYFANLQTTESGRLNLSYLGSADKQRTAVKTYLAKAVQAFINPRRGRKLTPAETAQLEALLPRLERSSSAAELIPLIHQGLDITQPYREA